MPNDVNCKHYDSENGWCKKRSDWSDPMPYIEYCPKSPCEYAEPIEQAMSDKDIILGLGCCNNGRCDVCPYHNRKDIADCREQNGNDAFKLLNVLVVENAKLKAEIERLNHIRAELSKEIDKLRDMVAQNEGVLPRYEQLIKAEAIKEFAEKLKSDIDPYQFIEEFYINAELAYEVRMDWFNEMIDNLVKEMTEEKE